MRTIIIGDIHGCYNSLRSLLDKVMLNREDQLILLGDYIDRGPHIKETIDFLISLKRGMGENLILLKGNHEDMLCRVAADRLGIYSYFQHPDHGKDRKLIRWYDSGREWYSNGGFETDKQIGASDRIEEYLHWFDTSLRLDFRESRFSVTHAGAVNGVAFDSKKVKIWNRKLNKYDGSLVICGHTPVRKPAYYRKGTAHNLNYEKLNELPKDGIIDIDTGCVYNNTLTALVVIDGMYYLENVRYIE